MKIVKHFSILAVAFLTLAGCGQHTEIPSSGKIGHQSNSTFACDTDALNIIYANARRKANDDTFFGGTSKGTRYRLNFMESFDTCTGIDGNTSAKNGPVKEVHHAVPRKIFKWAPGTITEQELHSLHNLRGIPNTPAGTHLHNKILGAAWRDFYKDYDKRGTKPSRSEILTLARSLDKAHGKKFLPPVKKY